MNSSNGTNIGNALNGIERLSADRPDELLFPEARAVVGADDTTSCQIADMRLVPGERSHVLIHVGDRHVVGTVADDDSPVVFSPIEADEALLGLAIIHDDAALKALVDEWLSSAPSVRCEAQLLRYRPGRRATFLIETTSEDERVAPQRFVAKLYHDEAKATSVHRAMAELYEHATAPTLTLAEPLGIDVKNRIVGQNMVIGQPLEPMLLAPGDRVAQTEAISQAAIALAAVHNLPVVSDKARSVEKALGKLCRRAAALHAALPDGCAPLVTLVDRLTDQLDQLGPSDARHLLHGDAKPDQFLLLRGGVGLLDFDHVGVGDPALDVADFTAKLRQRRLAGGQPDRATTDAFEAAFLAAYAGATSTGPEWDTRVAFCASASLARRALRSYQRAPRSQLGSRLVDECNELMNLRCNQGEDIR